MRRLAVLLALATFAACSNGSPMVPANFRSPDAVAAFQGVSPGSATGQLMPLVAVASFRGDELRIINPATDGPLVSASGAWPLGVPTLPRPTILASGSLSDPGPDLLLVASNEPRIQVIGTWLDGSSGYGVVSTIDLSTVVGSAAQIIGIQVVPVTAGDPVGDPPVAQVVPGMVWAVVAFADPGGNGNGQLAVLPFARGSDGKQVVLSGPPVRKALPFSPNGIAAAPDNLRLYFSTLDLVTPTTGAAIRGVAEVTMTGGIGGAWTVRALDARGSATTLVAAAFVAERTRDNFYTFAKPALRVYAGLDPSGCGPTKPINCGIATFDPALQGLATDPAIAPPGWPWPTQTYRSPMSLSGLPLAFGIAHPPAKAASGAPGTPQGSQVCQAPASPGNPAPPCPAVTTVSGSPPFNGNGYAQNFMGLAPALGQLWTSAAAFATSGDGPAFVIDLGRFGIVDSVDMLGVDTTRTRTVSATVTGPPGPTPDTAQLGYPAGTAAIGFWLDPAPGSGTVPQVVSDTTNLPLAPVVWPGFTRDEHWLVTYQGTLPGLAIKRGVVGITDADQLYVAMQDAAGAVGGVLPAAGYWMTGAVVASPDLFIHPGDISGFILDQDPCPSTRPNWVPAGQTTPAYVSTQPPEAHEAIVQSFLPPSSSLYPGGALLVVPSPDDAVLAQEYACLVNWFSDPQHPERRGKVLTAFGLVPAPGDYARGVGLRAGGFVLVGSVSGYAGRPELDKDYRFAWSEESLLPADSEALLLARKARRFYYPAASPTQAYSAYPGMTDPMEPGPALGFRLGRYCPTASPTIQGCDPLRSSPARGSGVDFFTGSGLQPMSRYPTGTSGGNAVTSFDKSTISGLEYLGRVFYTTFVGNALMMVPPGLDAGQSYTIR